MRGPHRGGGRDRCARTTGAGRTKRSRQHLRQRWPIGRWGHWLARHARTAWPRCGAGRCSGHSRMRSGSWRRSSRRARRARRDRVVGARAVGSGAAAGGPISGGWRRNRALPPSSTSRKSRNAPPRSDRRCAPHVTRYPGDIQSCHPIRAPGQAAARPERAATVTLTDCGGRRGGVRASGGRGAAPVLLGVWQGITCRGGPARHAIVQPAAGGTYRDAHRHCRDA